MAHASRLGQKRKKLGENNGQLRFVRHHRWHTQALCARYSLPSTTSLPRGLCLCHMFSGVVNIISLHIQLRLNTSEYRWIWEEGSEIVATP